MGMEQLICIKNLCINFPGKEAVRGVSFTLNSGELIALVGESGSGKSVLCRSLLGLPPKGAKVTFDVLERPELTAMSLVMQDAMTALDPAMPIGKQITEANRVYPPDPVEILAQVGIDHAKLRAKQYPCELSGGMRQRVAVAVSLAMRPKVIFADEPTTSLDAEIRMKIMELLNGIRQNGTALLFVTHDLSLVRDFADRILIMKEGRIIEQGATVEVFANPRTEYAKELIRYAAMSDPANHTHGNIHNHGLNMHSHSHTEPPMSLVELKDFSKSYSLGYGRVNHVLTNTDFTVYSNEIVGLCGPSGIGKSTLARCVAGLEKPSGGNRHAKNGINIQMIFQDSSSALNPRMSVGQLIAEPLYLRDGKQPSHKVILDLMCESELDSELITRRPRELSGGQRQRVAIARAIATRPDLIIADEPVSSLDVTTCSKIIHLLKRLKDEHNLTMLLISHDLHLLAHVSDRIIQMT
jgi:peptide/nickel transport system ATP-binding protein